MEYGICNCGAVTVYVDGEDYSMPKEKFDELFGGEDADGMECIAENWCNCNYCVNHWGIDLCGCGSGEKVGECEEGFDECKSNTPMQSMELGYNHVSGGWL